MVKRIIISIAIFIVLVIGSFFGYVMLTMRPVDNALIHKNIYALKDGYVNFFLIGGKEGYAAIDAGMNPGTVLKGLEKFNIDPKSIHSVFITHSDGDHAGGISAFPNAEIFIPELEEPMILGKDIRKIFGKERSGISPIAEMNYSLLAVKTQMEVDGNIIQTVSVPGHSPGSTAYIINNAYAFTGDMAIVSGKHLAPLPTFINNDQNLARQTAEQFEEKYESLEFIATAHDGILYLQKE